MWVSSALFIILAYFCFISYVSSWIVPMQIRYSVRDRNASWFHRRGSQVMFCVSDTLPDDTRHLYMLSAGTYWALFIIGNAQDNLGSHEYVTLHDS